MLGIVGGISTDNICIIGSIIFPYCHIDYSLVLMFTKVIKNSDSGSQGVAKNNKIRDFKEFMRMFHICKMLIYMIFSIFRIPMNVIENTV